jgi:HEAT repeat protein
MRLGRLLLLLVPVSLLVGASLRATGDRAFTLWLGALFQGLACLLALAASRGWRRSSGPSVVLLYVIALSWMLLAGVVADDWFVHLAQSVLLVVPLVSFGVQCLTESGAPALRRARQMAERLTRRADWPADLWECRSLPEVKALREALHVDASPAIQLLSNPRVEIRVAALAALEFREEWRPGQAEVVLNLARRTHEPAVRAAAIYALANRDNRVLVEALADFLADTSSEVRQAAREALLWDAERRWPWIRLAVRHALADPHGQTDGPLRLEGPGFPPEAVEDLTAWAAEKGVLGMRAALTLGAHYAQALAGEADPDLMPQLRVLAIDSHTPPMLRLEVAKLLQQHRELDPEALAKLLDPASPAPLRLIAAETLLGQGPSPEAVSALHELARLPNREIALATAEVVQRRLGVDLGLRRDEPPPPVQSRQAAEVARRLMAWAAQYDSGGGEQPAAAKPGDSEWRP